MNESICSQCHAICYVVEMEEREWHDYGGTNKMEVTRYNVSSCHGADVSTHEDELEDE